MAIACALIVAGVAVAAYALWTSAGGPAVPQRRKRRGGRHSR